MKSFLFLYPIRAYIEQELPPHNQELIMKKFNEIIDARYRQKNFQIYWLIFGAEDDYEKPDLSLLDSRFKIHEDDQIISCGLSFKQHRRIIYPSPKKILAQLNSINELVIGGFHQADCVKKVASQAHKSGLKVFVDEDTTDQYFTYLSLWSFPPIVRTPQEYASSLRWNLLAMKGKVSPALADRAVKNQRSYRKRQPWLVQI